MPRSYKHSSAGTPTAAVDVVVMAKAAVPGRVKTRLSPPLTADQAAAAHAAMLDCVLERASNHIPNKGLHLCLDASAGPAPGQLAPRAPRPWRVWPQAAGNLGARLVAAWREIAGGPVLFLGADSPDAPAEALTAAAGALAHADLAVGPSFDGGYWCLAGQKLSPAVFEDIDWGGANVYHQTLCKAQRAGLSVAELARWHDTDEADDLRALRRRLAAAAEPALLRLGKRLDDVLEGL